MYPKRQINSSDVGYIFFVPSTPLSADVGICQPHLGLTSRVSRLTCSRVWELCGAAMGNGPAKMGTRKPFFLIVPRPLKTVSRA